jgi:putative iron-dependent peroxidase
MNSPQPGVLAPVPKHAQFLQFSVRSGGSDIPKTLATLSNLAGGNNVVVGLGLSVLQRLGIEVAGIKAFPTHVSCGIDIPATPHSLCLWVRGDDPGHLMHLSRKINRVLAAEFRASSVVDAFQFDTNRDLTGYEDGTENPVGDAALNAIRITHPDTLLDGSTFMVVQRWEHDLDFMDSLDRRAQDEIFGRTRDTNEEMDDAPESAHIKRTEQESFDPHAFLLRRSMPWVHGQRQGLMFLAFTKRLEAFEVQLARMVGIEDGVTDGLFRYSTPISGSYYWCPPVASGKLDFGH